MKKFLLSMFIITLFTGVSFAGTGINIGKIERITVMSTGIVLLVWNDGTLREMPLCDSKLAEGKAMLSIALSAKTNGVGIYLTYYADNVQTGSWTFPDRITTW